MKSVKMTKSVKSMIALGSVLIVLGGVAIGWNVLMKDDIDETSDTSSSSEIYGSGIELIRKDPATINKIEIVNTTGEYNVLRTQKAETNEGKSVYTIEGYEDLLLDTSVLWTLSNNLSNVSSNSIVAENSDEVSKYGLDEPAVTAVVYLDSGDTVKFYVGDVSPVSSNTYFMLDGDDKVYTVSSSLFDNYRKGKDDFVSLTVLEEPAEDLYPIVNYVKVERDDLEYDILVEYDKKTDDNNYRGGTSAAHVLTEPISAYLSVENSVNVTNGIFGLTADSFYAIKPDENDIAEAGLAEPFCTVTVDCDDGNNYKFYMSEPFTDEDGLEYHYAMLDGNNVIYKVSAESAVWGTVQLVDFTSKIVFGSNVWDIDAMTVSGKDYDTIEFECEGSSKEDFTVKKDGKDFEMERFRLFYAFLISAPGEEFAIGKTVPDTEPSASITVKDSYLEQTYTVEFYDDTALRSLIVIDGECRYICSSSYVDTLLDNIGRITTGEEYVTTWK